MEKCGNAFNSGARQEAKPVSLDVVRQLQSRGFAKPHDDALNVTCLSISCHTDGGGKLVVGSNFHVDGLYSAILDIIPIINS